MPVVEYPNRRYKPDTSDEIYIRPMKRFRCDENCECGLITGSGGGGAMNVTLSDLVSLSIGRAELRKLQPDEFWEAVGAHGVNTDNLVYCVSGMKLYVEAPEVRIQGKLHGTMQQMGDNGEHHPLMDYIVIPEDPVSFGRPVMDMQNDTTVVVSNILAEGYSDRLWPQHRVVQAARTEG